VGEAKKEGRWNGAKPRKGRKWGNSPFLTALKKKNRAEEEDVDTTIHREISKSLMEQEA
jgi:hypothetical protein